jgi:N4-gp56 family major capsid protein
MGILKMKKLLLALLMWVVALFKAQFTRKTRIKGAMLFAPKLTLFDNTQTTGDSDLTTEMKTFYSDMLIDFAKPNLIHDQFGQKVPIPKNGGKTIEFRKYSPLAKATTALTEGVTPSGTSLVVSAITATVAQYGAYIELSDMFLMTAIDNNLIQASELLGDQAGRTLDTITRDILNAGTNVQYQEGKVSARYLLVGGNATAANNHYFSVKATQMASRFLKVNNAKPFDRSFVAIVHPDTAFDLQRDTDWIAASQYAGSTQIFEGELGKIGNVRYVESSEAKIFHAADLTSSVRTLTVASYNAKVITIDEALSAGQATALAGRKIIVDGYQYTVVSAAAGAAGAATITISETPTHNPADNDVVYPGEAGAAGRDIYSTLVLGKNAFGVTEIEGGGLQFIVKQLGSSGTADPLNQRATSGWKATKVAEILVDNYMVRVETASTFESGAN